MDVSIMKSGRKEYVHQNMIINSLHPANSLKNYGIYELDTEYKIEGIKAAGRNGEDGDARGLAATYHTIAICMDARD